MVKKYNDFDPQLESAVLADKAKLSLYKKSVKSGIPAGILEEIYNRGYNTWNPSFGYSPEQFAFDRVNSFISGGFAVHLDEDLLDEKRGLWDNIHAKRERIKAGSGERMRKPGSKGAPTDAALKASQNEDADPCWKNYKQIGMKMKNGKKVPNCVPVKEEDIDEGKLKDSLKVAALVGALGAHGGKIYDVGNIATHHDDPALAAATIASYAHPASRALQALPTALKVDKAGKGENEFERQKKYPKKKVQESKVTEEPHSKNPKKPSSRFIGSNELTDIYKSETPGQIIKRVVKEQLEEGIRPGTRNYASVKDNPRKYANEYPKGFRQPGVASKEELRKQAAELSKGVKVKRVEEETIEEATYKGKKVSLNKPMQGDVKKSKVFVDPDGDGKAQKVNFGDKSLSIKKHIPARKKSYCARSGGQGNLTDKTSANYWSRRAWNCEETEVNELSVPAGTTGKRKEVSSTLVAIRMASGKIEKHPPGKSGSSGGGDE